MEFPSASFAGPRSAENDRTVVFDTIVAIRSSNFTSRRSDLQNTSFFFSSTLSFNDNDDQVTSFFFFNFCFTKMSALPVLLEIQI